MDPITEYVQWVFLNNLFTHPFVSSSTHLSSYLIGSGLVFCCLTESIPGSNPDLPYPVSTPTSGPWDPGRRQDLVSPSSTSLRTDPFLLFVSGDSFRFSTLTSVLPTFRLDPYWDPLPGPILGTPPVDPKTTGRGKTVVVGLESPPSHGDESKVHHIFPGSREERGQGWGEVPTRHQVWTWRSQWVNHVTTRVLSHIWLRSVGP